jgi:formate hydrogenlyase subunit 6/NADH:ubiquinone oxidoreductase subunit I
VQVCPVDAIVLCRVPTAPGFDREDLFLTMEKLYANESVPRSPATGTSLIQSHAPEGAPAA